MTSPRGGMPASPRLLVVTPDFPPAVGGIQLLTARLTDALDGFEVGLVAPPPAAHPLLVAGLPRAAARLPHRAAMAVLNLFAVVAALRRRPDVVLNMHLATAPAALVLRRLLGVPFVQYAYAKEVPARPGLARFALTRASRVIVISRYGHELVTEQGADPAAVRRIPPGVDQRPAPVARRVTGPRVVTVGRLQDEHKGHDTLVRAMAVVREEIPGVRCRIVGDGPLRPGLEALAARVGSAPCIDFLGRLTDAERDQELADATVFCMPSRLPAAGAGEGFGIVYLEAGAFGVPSVAANVGGSVDAVRHGSTGLLIEDPHDHVALAAALIRLLDDPELTASLGAQARDDARAATWERMAAAVGDVCREIVGARGR